MALDLTGIGSVADLIKTGLDKIWPDKTEQERAEAALVLASLNGQLAANTQEAASSSLFVSGWRPSVGWVCSSAFAIQFVVGPIAQWTSTLLGHPVVFPTLDLGTMMPLLLGLLGLGGLRTVEKINKVAS
jgi:Holin of 3TMs, for gene-transfer release